VAAFPTPCCWSKVIVDAVVGDGFGEAPVRREASPAGAEDGEGPCDASTCDGALWVGCWGDGEKSPLRAVAVVEESDLLRPSNEGLDGSLDSLSSSMSSSMS